MKLRILKWGNSAAVRLPSRLLAQIHSSVGGSLTVEVRPDGVLLSAARRKYLLEELVAQCDPNVPQSTDRAVWGEVRPMGREAW
ncbi:AbrB/MazE/SpoVT family DNA-binding domain-containing protein [Pandoraea bronchicola]|uniref:AbrB/MazE/SpoVT family DNA-binding domain-containing protein n=1 Tax=Pandoraea bronchicola TaxID=2508287 RepID=UPI00123FD1D0|nr:AbrB/MazE/SpoVT family DNA-binding domain-containing protein [Pandoraea bronchicola]